MKDLTTPPFKASALTHKNGFQMLVVDNFNKQEVAHMHWTLLSNIGHYFLKSPIIAAINNRKAVVAGGFLECLLTGRQVEDIDIFCDKSTCDDIVKKLKENNTVSNSYLLMRFQTPFMEEWLFRENSLQKHVKLQFIFNRGNELSEVLDSFDFTCTKCGFVVSNEGLQLKYCDTFFTDVYHRVLKIDRDHCLSDAERSAKTLARVVKYVSRGYNIQLDTLQKVEDAIAKHGSYKISLPGREYEIQRKGY